MSSYSPYRYPQQPPQAPPPVHMPPHRRGVPWWGWLLILGGVFVLLVCGGGIAFFAYVGSVGPDTKIYTGGEVPRKFMDIAKDVGAVAEGEQVLFFYSDALSDIREGMYIVTDKKVSIYIRDAAQPLQAVPYQRVTDVSLARGSSWIEDSAITLQLEDGSIVSFPVSIEMNRDMQVEKAIRQRIKGGK